MDLKALVNIEWGLTSTNILPIDNGLINRTWLVRTPKADFILQNVNTLIFKNPTILQEQLVCIAAQIELPNLVPLHYLPTRAGQHLLFIDGQTFRLARAITPSTTIHIVSAAAAQQAAYALLEFHAALSKVEASSWQEPIVGFLDVNKRLQTYHEAVQTADEQRKIVAQHAIQTIQKQWSVLTNWQLFLERAPRVLIHADPKISNFLFSYNGKQVRALIDWDTIQLGSPYYDFADMIRSYCSYGEEVDSSQPLFRADIFEVLLATFKADENKVFAAACGVILLQALRFLTDYLQNDVYYKVKDAQHNLRRTQNQLRLVSELQAYWLTTRKRGQ